MRSISAHRIAVSALADLVAASVLGDGSRPRAEQRLGPAEAGVP